MRLLLPVAMWLIWVAILFAMLITAWRKEADFFELGFITLVGVFGGWVLGRAVWRKLRRASSDPDAR